MAGAPLQDHLIAVKEAAHRLIHSEPARTDRDAAALSLGTHKQ